MRAWLMTIHHDISKYMKWILKNTESARKAAFNHALIWSNCTSASFWFNCSSVREMNCRDCWISEILVADPDPDDDGTTAMDCDDCSCNRAVSQPMAGRSPSLGVSDEEISSLCALSTRHGHAMWTVLSMSLKVATEVSWTLLTAIPPVICICMAPLSHSCLSNILSSKGKTVLARRPRLVDAAVIGVRNAAVHKSLFAEMSRTLSPVYVPWERIQTQHTPDSGNAYCPFEIPFLLSWRCQCLALPSSSSSSMATNQTDGLYVTHESTTM